MTCTKTCQMKSGWRLLRTQCKTIKKKDNMTLLTIDQKIKLYQLCIEELKNKRTLQEAFFICNAIRHNMPKVTDDPMILSFVKPDCTLMDSTTMAEFTDATTVLISKYLPEFAVKR